MRGHGHGDTLMGTMGGTGPTDQRVSPCRCEGMEGPVCVVVAKEHGGDSPPCVFLCFLGCPLPLSPAHPTQTHNACRTLRTKARPSPFNGTPNGVYLHTILLLQTQKNILLPLSASSRNHLQRRDSMSMARDTRPPETTTQSKDKKTRKRKRDKRKKKKNYPINGLDFLYILKTPRFVSRGCRQKLS